MKTKQSKRNMRNATAKAERLSQGRPVVSRYAAKVRPAPTLDATTAKGGVVAPMQGEA